MAKKIQSSDNSAYYYFHDFVRNYEPLLITVMIAVMPICECIALASTNIKIKLI